MRRKDNHIAVTVGRYDMKPEIGPVNGRLSVLAHAAEHVVKIEAVHAVPLAIRAL